LFWILLFSSLIINFTNKFLMIPMGSSLSPIIADIVMQDLEEIAISNLQIHQLFYYRYYRYRWHLLALLSEYIDDILIIFNSLHTRLQFIMKVGNDNRLNFFDTTLTIKELFSIHIIKLHFREGSWISIPIILFVIKEA